MAQVAVAHPSPVPDTFYSNSVYEKLPSSAPESSSIDSAPNAPAASSEPNLTSTNDPHHLPVFDGTTLTAPTAPILYLPPLLSSLPSKYESQVPPVPTTNNPKPPFRNTETRLPDIDPASLALHKALHQFRPVTAEYSTTPYGEAFNWDELHLPEEMEREWYCVVFRSKRKEGSDGGPLYEADRQAHEEAVQNGGLILYWYGIPHPETGLNLATCIWQSRQHAIAANSRPHHVRAMKLAAASYERYELQRFRLAKVKGDTSVTITPFDKGDVGW